MTTTQRFPRHISRYLCVGVIVALGVMSLAAIGNASSPLQVGYAKVDITPQLTPDNPVWLAGYGHGRRATGVHDPIYARCFVIASGENAERKLAFVSVDVVGLQYPFVQYVRERLPEIEYTLIASTHNHEAPDVVGIWGATPFQRGVDSQWLRKVAGQLVEVVKEASAKLEPATVSYGTANDENLLGDSRLPKVYDGVLRVLRFRSAGNGSEARNLGLLVQWSCHPEALGSKNTLITADFPYATIAALEEKYDCPTALFSGAVGGLMAPPGGRFRNSQGELLHGGQYEFAEVYGRLVADLAEKAIDAAEPIELTPFTISAKPIAVPLENRMYRAARLLGVIRRKGRHWTGDSEVLGEPMTANQNPDGEGQTIAVETEVSYLRLGQLHVAGIPGEIYPELVYGKIQDPADPAADFPDAPLEKSVVDILPSERWLLLGLANDEIGYIIPRRQWDQQAPFAYGRRTSQYGEINSCGSEVAPIIMRALEKRVAEAK